jgi:hypothetical protein
VAIDAEDNEMTNQPLINMNLTEEEVAQILHAREPA